MEVDIDLSSLEIRDKKRSLDSSNFEIPKTSQTNADATEGTELRRSARKKVRAEEPTEKRRILLRPRKLQLSSSTRDIENYYLDKRVKLSSPSLETIFEEPKKDLIMSSRKFKRSIFFNDYLLSKNKAKTKRRTMKGKKICSSFKKLGKKIGMNILLDKLKEMEDNQEQQQ